MRLIVLYADAAGGHRQAVVDVKDNDGKARELVLGNDALPTDLTRVTTYKPELDDRGRPVVDVPSFLPEYNGGTIFVVETDDKSKGLTAYEHQGARVQPVGKPLVLSV